MKRLVLFCLLLSVSTVALFAQRTLESRENTDALSVFIDKDPAIDSEGGAQAGAIITCPITLNLSFSSNVDRTVDVYKTEERGDVRFYYLRFIIGRFRGASYANRTLEVTASGFQPLRISLASLGASETKRFDVFDPNATVGVGCFYQNFNEGVELFKKAMYVEAREKYRLSMECTDMPPDMNMPQRIADIDSIQKLRPEADKYYDMLMYKDAMNAYQKIVAYNIDDQYARIRAAEAEQKYNDNCSNYFAGAELSFANGNYEEAKRMYEMVVMTSCPKTTEAELRLVSIRKIEYDRNKRIQVIAYEFSPTAPFGISVGAYKEKIFSGYFSLRFNGDLIESLRQDAKDVVIPADREKAGEFNISAGWTTMRFTPAAPIWGFFGAGYTGVGEWAKDEDFPEDDPSLKIRSAISPEIGLLAKLGPVALRYTFQYRVSLAKADQDFIGQIGHVFGIGICF